MPLYKPAKRGRLHRLGSWWPCCIAVGAATTSRPACTPAQNLAPTSPTPAGLPPWRPLRHSGGCAGPPAGAGRDGPIRRPRRGPCVCGGLCRLYAAQNRGRRVSDAGEEWLSTASCARAWRLRCGSVLPTFCPQNGRRRVSLPVLLQHTALLPCATSTGAVLPCAALHRVPPCIHHALVAALGSVACDSSVRCCGCSATKRSAALGRTVCCLSMPLQAAV